MAGPRHRRGCTTIAARRCQRRHRRRAGEPASTTSLSSLAPQPHDRIVHLASDSNPFDDAVREQSQDHRGLSGGRVASADAPAARPCGNRRDTAQGCRSRVGPQAGNGQVACSPGASGCARTYCGWPALSPCPGYRSRAPLLRGLAPGEAGGVGPRRSASRQRRRPVRAMQEPVCHTGSVA